MDLSGFFFYGFFKMPLFWKSYSNYDLKKIYLKIKKKKISFKFLKILSFPLTHTKFQKNYIKNKETMSISKILTKFGFILLESLFFTLFWKSQKLYDKKVKKKIYFLFFFLFIEPTFKCIKNNSPKKKSIFLMFLCAKP